MLRCGTAIINRDVSYFSFFEVQQMEIKLDKQAKIRDTAVISLFHDQIEKNKEINLCAYKPQR